MTKKVTFFTMFCNPSRTKQSVTMRVVRLFYGCSCLLVIERKLHFLKEGKLWRTRAEEEGGLS